MIGLWDANEGTSNGEWRNGGSCELREGESCFIGRILSCVYDRDKFEKRAVVRLDGDWHQPTGNTSGNES